MKGTVERWELVDNNGPNGPEDRGFVWRATCPSHQTTWDSDWELQARSLARETSSFCEDCRSELERELRSVNPVTEWSRTDQRMEDAERAEEEMFADLEGR